MTKKQKEIIAKNKEENFLLYIQSGDEPVVTVDYDGKVTIYKDGGSPEAAKIFWEAVAKMGIKQSSCQTDNT